MHLPKTLAFVDTTPFEVNGYLTTQHPLNQKPLPCYPGADYTNYCSRDDFDNFDYQRFVKEDDKKVVLIKKDDNVFLYKYKGLIAALCPLD
jgi:hypothetical protein